MTVLLVTAVAHLELWPLTSYRLFSEVRTDTRTVLELVVVARDGTTSVVPADPGVVTTDRRHRELPASSPDRRRERVTAWLAVAGADPADVDVVRLERVRTVLDPRTLDRRETARSVVLEVEP